MQGRKKTMLGAGALSTVGTVVCATSYSWAQLISGRLLLGAGVGAACVSSPCYLTEIAPANHRGDSHLQPAAAAWAQPITLVSSARCCLGRLHNRNDGSQDQLSS
jgi:MFS family permease